MTDAVLPVREGDEGPAVADVQRRLRTLGIGALTDDDGCYGPATRAAVEGFQHRRGLRVDGVCGPQTWDTLVEAGFRLGDRLLYLRTPMFRGDDVADLQQRLGALGFDTGRVDGIFGSLTSAAVADFQGNAGQPADGIVGPGTLHEILRVQSPQQSSELVSTVRARELLRQAPPTLTGRHVALGEQGGLATIVAALRRRLAASGARVTEIHHPNDAAHAQQANAAGAGVYVGLRLDPRRPGCATAYYTGYRFESPGGHRLADLVQGRVPGALGIPDHGQHGMSLPVLRETRMPAVVVEVGPAPVVVTRAPALADALCGALRAWAAADWD